MRTHLICSAFLVACTTAGGGGGSGGSGGEGGGGNDGPDAAPIDLCTDDPDKRADIEGAPFTCDGPPEYVTLEIEETGRDYDVFVYEASHPLATATHAFPCAGLRAADNVILDYQAPLGDAQACSKAGVRPWHTVKWEDASNACKAVPVEEGEHDWRLCEREEWVRTCRGPEPGTAFPGGSELDARCNIRTAYTAPDSDFTSEAPTGQFADCVTEEGVFDLVGNVAEWSNERDEMNSRNRYNMGRGWQIVAQMHQEQYFTCDASRVPQVGQFATSYKTESLGFRCCRLHVD